MLVIFMEIYITFFGGLETSNGLVEIGDDGSLWIEEATTIRDLLERLEISSERVPIRLVNGIHQRLDYELQRGDRLGLVPHLGGG